jgi:molybdenum cofactor synthesis domain-containing protein
MSTQIRVAVITASDACSRGERVDESGAALVELLEGLGAIVVEKRVLADDLEPLKQALAELSGREDINLIVTTGGTGLGPRDNTPEATLKVTKMAMISRGVAGVASGTLIINLPGSPTAVRESFAVIAPVLAHAVDLLAGWTRH